MSGNGYDRTPLWISVVAIIISVAALALLAGRAVSWEAG